SAIKGVIDPIGAIAIIKYAANLTLHTKYTKLAIAMAAYKDWDKKDAGTWRYMILNEFPWTKSSGVNIRPHAREKR
mgnify:CR=1